MRNRSRVTSFAWTRRAHDVPAVVRHLPALVGETLEDRTLLSGVTDSSSSESSSADLLDSATSLSFLLPADAVSGLLANGSGQESPPLVANTPQDGLVTQSFHVRVDAHSHWHDIVNSSASGEGVAPGHSQVLVTIEADGSDSTDGATQFVNITIEFVEAAGRFNGAATNGESRFNFASGSELDQSELSLPISNPLATATYSIGLPNVVAVGSVSRPASGSIAVSSWENDLRSVKPFEINSTNRADQPASDFDNVDAVDDLKTNSLGSFSQPVTLLAKFSSATESAGIPYDQVPAASTAMLFEPAVLRSFGEVANSATAFESVAVVMSPADGLQAAAAPLLAVVETVLASLDTTARTLLALFTGSGGGTSPIAPVVQPIVGASPVVIDSKRPRWALHDGLIEELAAYSLVVAPDQHFDLKDFGPESSAADPVIRIEFDVPPQHGQVSVGVIPGSFQYSADPGFSGADTARFVITRASGQTVAGAVTILVGDRGLFDRPPAPVRQVELPIRDQRLSDRGAAAIDAGFGLLDGGMDLP